MSNPIQLRAIQAADLQAIVTLFKETVHHVNAKDYTPEQLQVWGADHVQAADERWQGIVDNIAYLAERDGLIVGFADMTAEGYLDRLFVHKDYQRQGIASLLVKHVESIVSARGVKRLTTEASITAKPFFEHLGYRVLREQNKPRAGGVILTNYFMEKCLGKIL